MKFLITPNPTKVKEQYFKHGNNFLTFTGFSSNIKGLKIFLQNANGIGVNLDIANTNTTFNLEINEYGFVWFEWISSDKNYDIELIIN